jgi:hypothetical protein
MQERRLSESAKVQIRLLAIHDPEIERSLSLPRLSLRGQAVLLKEYGRVEQVMADEGQVADSIE